MEDYDINDSINKKSYVPSMMTFIQVGAIYCDMERDFEVKDICTSHIVSIASVLVSQNIIVSLKITIYLGIVTHLTINYQLDMHYELHPQVIFQSR